MEANDNRDSPYITTWGLVPPSPTRSVEFDHTSPFDSAFGITDSNIQGSNPLGSPGYPNTPSYNGSYYNSPFSQHSELVDLEFLQDLPSGSTAASGVNDYEPSEYEAPNQGGSLLMFPTDSDFMSSHFSPGSNPSDAQRTRGSPFDHGSPVSSPGLDDNKHGGRHSRASSVASNQPSPSAQQPSTLSPQPQFQPSPRLDVLSSFGNMSVRTPNWGSQPLPNTHSPHIGTESQQQKPQSPPRLTLPPGMTFGSEATAVPKINASNCKEEDGVMFSIEPATPVGGGDAGVRQHTPFQQTLKTLTQGVPLGSSDGDIGSQQYPQPQQPAQHTSPFASPHIGSNEHSTGDYLFQDSGIRQGRQSDGWQDGSFMDNSQNQLGLSEGAFGSRVLRNVDEQHRQQLQTFTFGGNSGGDSIRRAVSDSLAAPRYHRQSRSEDIRPIPTSTNSAGYHGQSNSIGGTGPHFLFPPSSHADFIQRQQQGQFLHPNDLPTSTSTPGLQPQGRSLSPGMGHIRRASSGSRSGRGAEVWGTQADQLAPHVNTLGRRMSPYPTPNASPMVNYAELDEINDMGLGNMGGAGGNSLGLGGGLGLGLGVGVSSAGVDGIPGIGEPPVSAGYGEEVAITGRNAYTRDDASSQGIGHHRAESITSLNAVDPGGPVTKQNVTTGRTANASIKRRKQAATFECTVPGCGSTFTRGFNLKGHMRSHYEQKPYKCHWPGCEKGFARQHDCKRHEQLHSNYRPFVCDGCGKNFARMDALNRHLKSEAGLECAKVAEEKRDGQGDEMDDDEEKPQILESPPLSGPRRRNTGESGIGNPGGGMLGLPDDLWGVAV